jgi:hypothetical protein
MGEQYRRDVLHSRLTDAYRESDKLIVTVASGVLGLSVAFLDRLNNPCQVWMLQLAWVSLALSVGSVLASLLLEQADRRRRIEQLDSGDEETDGKTDGLINMTNIAGVSGFLLGLGSLVAFLCVNIK